MGVLDKFERDVIKAARKGLGDAADKVEERLKENTGLVDHTLKQLAALGHPYGRRNPQEIHDPPWLVHRQTGNLQDHIRIIKENSDIYDIGVDPIVPYLDKVIEGSALMVPRDFPLETLHQLEEDGTIYETIEKEINKAL